MATIKSFTDLQQSKRLAEILPLESADMYYFLDPTPAGNIYHLTIQRVDVGIKNLPHYDEGDIPCWSLASLLSVLPDYTLQSSTDGKVFVVCESKKPMISDAYDNPVDACVAMVEKLHELKML